MFQTWNTRRPAASCGRSISTRPPRSAISSRYPGCRFTHHLRALRLGEDLQSRAHHRRLHQLKSGGHATRIAEWRGACSGPVRAVHRFKWRGGLAWPPELTQAESRRLAARYRN
jgi:hypothetical protein